MRGARRRLLCLSVLAWAALARPSVAGGVQIEVIHHPARAEYFTYFDLVVRVLNMGKAPLPSDPQDNLYLAWATHDKNTGNLIRYLVHEISGGEPLQSGESRLVKLRCIVGAWERPEVTLSLVATPLISPTPEEVRPLGPDAVLRVPVTFAPPRKRWEHRMIRGLGLLGLVAPPALWLLAAVLGGIERGRGEASGSSAFRETGGPDGVDARSGEIAAAARTSSGEGS